MKARNLDQVVVRSTVTLLPDVKMAEPRAGFWESCCAQIPFLHSEPSASSPSELASGQLCGAANPRYAFKAKSKA